MDTPSVPARARSGSMLRAIVIGGLACGVCDFIFAVVYHNAPWAGVARSVARGLLSKEVVSSGAGWVVAVGVILHFVISFGAAVVFVAASRRVPMLVRGRGVPGGLVYGAVVYAVMKWVVVPASAIVVPNYPMPPDWGALVGHMFVVGLPIALAARWLGPARCVA